MTPTLEERVSTLENLSRKLKEDDDAIFADLVKALRGVSSLGEKLKDFRDETAGNFASLRGEMDTRFAQVDTRFDQVDARFAQVDARFAQVDARFDQVDARFAQVDARFDQMDARFATLDAKVDGQSGKLDLLIAHLGLATG